MLDQRIVSSLNTKRDESPAFLIDFFHSLEDSEIFPYDLALTSFEQLEQEAASPEELLQYCLEDSIFAALYVTFYEHLLIALRGNPALAIDLIDKFAVSSEKREELIAKQTQEHLDYVMNNGYCAGCGSCANHRDVFELVEYWQRQDLDFFIKLYLGMQTIQLAFEQLIYDFLPENLEALPEMTAAKVLSYRQYLFGFVEEELSRC